MFFLRGNLITSGFRLERNGETYFQTQHRFGFMPHSRVEIAGDIIEITTKDFHNSNYNIIKNGTIIGQLILYHNRTSMLDLLRQDGGTDRFILAEDGFSRRYILTLSDQELLRFDASINPLLLSDKYTVDIMHRSYPMNALFELIYYAGELLFRRQSPK